MKSLLDFLRRFNYEQLYWFFEMGFPKRKGDIYQIRASRFKILPPPVFFLSSGRCGTQWFAEYLKKDKSLTVFHAPSPDLAVQSLLAYQEEDRLMDESSSTYRHISEIFLAGRENYLRYSYKTMKRFVETNNQITFFAPLIARILPNARFVHLYRHPGEFVRSGIRRGWYSKDEKITGLKLIKPREDSDVFPMWNEFSQLEKISWLWRETNRFIESFKQNHDTEVFDFNFNRLTIDNLEILNQELDFTISKRKMERSLKKRYNVQSHGSFEQYANWSEKERSRLRAICGDLAGKYGYDL